VLIQKAPQGRCGIGEPAGAPVGCRQVGQGVIPEQGVRCRCPLEVGDRLVVLVLAHQQDPQQDVCLLSHRGWEGVGIQPAQQVSGGFEISSRHLPGRVCQDRLRRCGRGFTGRSLAGKAGNQQADEKQLDPDAGKSMNRHDGKDAKDVMVPSLDWRSRNHAHEVFRILMFLAKG
jgi:hypothetical protein